MNYGCLLTGTPFDIVELAQEAEYADRDSVFLPDDNTNCRTYGIRNQVHTEAIGKRETQ